MLSRSNSNAGDRLRRAKSTSSAHTTSSGHQRSSTYIDPFVVRQHAETAAVEAFQRAKLYEKAAVPQAYRPVPPKLQRRRSQATGKTEGSHFEDARLGRRRATSKKDDNRDPKPARSQHVPSEARTSEASEGEVVITRKRSVIPPGSGPWFSLYDPSSVASTSRSERRKSQAARAEGSPAPRNTALTPDSCLLQERDDYCTRVGETDGLAQSPKPSIRETQTDDEILALARDHCPPASHTKKLRERKSFILAPFQRRRPANAQKGSKNSYDTVLPPFNYADGGLPPPPLPPPPPVYTAPAFTVHTEKRSRHFSDSLKGRFKKAFRKTARVPTVIPAQQVEATHLHYPVTTPLSTPTVQPEEQEDPFTTSIQAGVSHLAVPGSNPGTDSRHSSGEQSAAKSRVTSWTNSTVAGTWSTRDDVEDHDTADEQGPLKRSDSTSTLKKARSFFGRPVKNELRRPRKLDVGGSDESAGLYSALQERIQPADSASQGAVSDVEAQSVRAPSALDSLPSRQRADSTVSSRGGWQSSTVRSVTPDPTAYRLDIPSPVAEVLSPDATRRRSRQEESHEELTPRRQLQRRPAMKAPTPSKEQIERRIERCKNRWQSPLDELSPSAPRPSRHAIEENPYELRSLSRTLQQPITSDLPHHARVGEQLPGPARPDVLSPSVYSRGTDGESPRPDSPAATTSGGMIVTITGREVKSFAISPSKAEQGAERPIHASQEWRRWLSDEMNSWDGSSTPQDFMLPKNVLKNTPPASFDGIVEQRPSGQRLSSASSSLEPPQTQVKARDHRPRTSSRLSSYMNDRYPMINTGRNSSDQSVGRRSRISSLADSRPGTSESHARPCTVPQERKSSAEGKSLKSALARQRVVTKPRSFARLASSIRESASDERTKADEVVNAAPAKAELASHQVPNATSTADVKPVPAKRPKSAFDLRANYKTSTTALSRPLEVRRKAPAHTILDDSTIRHISAGPYAHSSKPTDDNKENISPHPASDGLPALSSSEWLAAGSNSGRKREGQSLSAVHLAYRQRSAGRCSPARSAAGTPVGGSVGDGSPGHRLATSWLDGRKGRGREEKEGSSPAFV